MENNSILGYGKWISGILTVAMIAGQGFLIQQQWTLTEKLAKTDANVIMLREQWSRRVTTGELNRWFEAAVDANPPPAPGGSLDVAIGQAVELVDRAMIDHQRLFTTGDAVRPAARGEHRKGEHPQRETGDPRTNCRHWVAPMVPAPCCTGVKAGTDGPWH